MTKYFIGIGLVAVIFIVGAWFGYLLTRPTEKTEITSQAILESLQSKGFLVTEASFTDQKIVINNKSGSFWKDLLWGQRVTASAIMKVGLGIDLTKLRKENIAMTGDGIQITLPDVEVQSVELTSDINLENNQGVFKKLLDNNDGYNQAFQQLRNQAQNAASGGTVKQKALENAKEEIKRLIGFLAPQMVVRFK